MGEIIIIVFFIEFIGLRFIKGLFVLFLYNRFRSCNTFIVFVDT